MCKKSISEDANNLISMLYNAYLVRCNFGLSKFDAKYFGDDINIVSDYAINLNSCSLNKTLKELWQNNFIYAFEHDDHICQIRLNCFKTIEYLDDKSK